MDNTLLDWMTLLATPGAVLLMYLWVSVSAMHNTVRELLKSEEDGAEARLKSMEQAIEPLARWIICVPTHYGDDHLIPVNLRAGDVRRAADLLAEKR